MGLGFFKSSHKIFSEYNFNKLHLKTQESRPPSAAPPGSESAGPPQPSPRPPLTRADSRSAFPQQQLRPGAPPQLQPRPQFQPGGPVTSPPQLVRPGLQGPRGPVPSGPPGSQQTRPPPPPLRNLGPQSVAPQPGPRPLQSPTSAQPPQRGPLPTNLQFGPRQPPQFGGATTPDANRPLINQQLNGASKNGVAPAGIAPAQLPRQPSQGSLRGSDPNNTYQNKPVNLDNQSVNSDNQNANKTENGMEIPGVPKGRSYSIAAAPGSPSPFKMEDDRRKSVSAIGGKIEEFTSRSPALGLIQEGKVESKDNLRGSKDSVRSEASNEGAKDVPERSESRLSGSKITDSLIGALSTSTPKKKSDDDDDVVLQNSAMPEKNANEPARNQNKTDLSDRSPSLTRSDDSPEPKVNTQQNKPQSVTSEPQRPKTPKMETKQDMKFDLNTDAKPPMTPNRATSQTSKSPHLESKPLKKPNELNTSTTPVDSKKSTPRKVVSAPKTRPKGNNSNVDNVLR